MSDPSTKQDASSVRFKGLAAAGAALLALGQAASLGVTGSALRHGVPYLRGETCPMGSFGASIFALMALLFFDPLLVLATVLVLRLARRQLPRWARVALVAGMAVAVIAPVVVLVACAR